MQCLSFRKMPDPKCEADEALCKSRIGSVAEEVEKKEKEKERLHEEMKKLEEEQMKVVEKIPEKCKKMRL